MLLCDHRWGVVLRCVSAVAAAAPSNEWPEWRRTLLNTHAITLNFVCNLNNDFFFISTTGDGWSISHTWMLRVDEEWVYEWWNGEVFACDAVYCLFVSSCVTSRTSNIKKDTAFFCLLWFLELLIGREREEEVRLRIKISLLICTPFYIYIYCSLLDRSILEFAEMGFANSLRVPEVDCCSAIKSFICMSSTPSI